MWFKSCPRCHDGDLSLECDIHGRYICCAQCGHYLKPFEAVVFLSERLGLSSPETSESLSKGAGVRAREGPTHNGGKPSKRRSGMPAHRIPEEKRNGVLRLWFEERVRNAAEIARKVGVSRPTVDKIIREEENRRKTAAGALAPVAVAPEQTVPAAAELESAAVITAPPVIQTPPAEVAASIPPGLEVPVLPRRENADGAYPVVRAGFLDLGKDELSAPSS